MMQREEPMMWHKQSNTTKLVIIIISILTGLWLAERFGMNEGRLRGMFSFSPTGLTLNAIFGLIDV